jgi:KaiC/GvpD/RAD55 family RecA-like ATPase
MARALTTAELKRKKYETISFTGEFYQAFGEPETKGVWFIWGNSGNGKTTFALQLCQELSRFGKVGFNSIEEGHGLTMQNAVNKSGIKSKILFFEETIEQLSERLLKRKSPDIMVIDSFQYTQLSFKAYLEFKKKHANKLIIFLSQAEGKKPLGKPANAVMYDASFKIWIEGFKAFSKGRYIGPNGGHYVIYKEGAEKYYGI